MTLAPCPTHGSTYRALHEHNFRGIVEAIDDLFLTISGVVGTQSYSRCAVGYPWNFEGIVRALEDLNTTISGIQGGGANVVGGSGIYVIPSGDYSIVNADYGTIVSGVLKPGSNINFAYGAGGDITINSSATISGTQAAVYVQDTAPPQQNGALWFDTLQGRTFVYVEASGWYQTNAEAFAIKGDLPPSGSSLNAPPRDGSLWFNTLVGNLFVYDATSSGWYETGPSRSFAYGAAAPAPSAEGAGWYSTSDNTLKVWNGTGWIST
jgi:hypothetical protein